jgi:hypothetical protein
MCEVRAHIVTHDNNLSQLWSRLLRETGNLSSELVLGGHEVRIGLIRVAQVLY